MKTIKKRNADSCLAYARKARWNWEDFRNNDPTGYHAVRQQALKEQADECAYTGLWLGDGTTQQVHLDHFLKKSIYENKTFDYDNLFAAAKDLPYGADYKDKCICGPKPKADEQYSTFWSPCQQNLEKAFWYRQDGFMVPADSLSNEEKEMAQHTIDMFNLNSGDLIRKRSGVIKLVRSMSDCDADMVRECLNMKGFSFLVDFELRHKV